jgi:hypothetical protein
MQNIQLAQTLLDAVPKDRPYKIGVGSGLHLLVMPSGSKYWRFNYRFSGKYQSLSVGVFPDVSLMNAELQRDAIKQQLKEGKDPALERKNQKLLIKIVEGDAIASQRYSISNDGSLTIRYGKRSLIFSPGEVAELRRFLDSTRTVNSEDAS